MAIKKVLLNKKVNGTLYDIYPKTDATIVDYAVAGTWNIDNSTTLTGTISVKTALDNLYTLISGNDGAMDSRVTALENNYTTLFQGVDDTTLDQIKEIADFIKANDSAIQALDAAHTADVGAWTDANRSQTVKAAIEAIETLLGTANDSAASSAGSGTAFARIARLESAGATAADDIDALESRMDTAEADIDALEGRMDTAEDDIDALEAALGTASDAAGNGTAFARIKALEDTDYAPFVANTATQPTASEADDDVLYLFELPSA